MYWGKEHMHFKIAPCVSYLSDITSCMLVKHILLFLMAVVLP